MHYISTRGAAPPVSFLDAVLAGLAPDGGLYVPERWPTISPDALAKKHITTFHHSHTVAETTAALAGDLPGHDISRIADAAYAREAESGPPIWPPMVAPLVQIDTNQWVLELFHGPSLSFKDVAMQFIAPLYEFALTQRDGRLSVVCATSGDTGGAAVEALKHSERADLFVLLPKGRVSAVQRRFMTASGANNVHALEIDGDFDACQAIVKALFKDAAFAANAQLSGVNSINWARILAQSVYFQIAAHRLGAHGPVNFSVPTGNFGDAFSGFAAKKLGAPVGRILLATNANDILVRALHTGRYERAAASYATLSPAMDIQVASNFERILFEALDRDGEHVRRLYDQFAQAGGFDIPASALAFLRDHFDAASVSDEQTEQSMRAAWCEGDRGYLACPHTAVALHALGQSAALNADPCVVLATAHPAKFPDTVAEATRYAPPLPARCADLFEREEIITPMPNDIDAIKRLIAERSRAWRG